MTGPLGAVQLEVIGGVWVFEFEELRGRCKKEGGGGQGEGEKREMENAPPFSSSCWSPSVEELVHGSQLTSRTEQQ